VNCDFLCAMHRLVHYLAGGGDGAGRRRRHPEVEDVESSGASAAALCSDYGALSALLLRGLDPNARDRGERPLVLSVLQASDTACAELLLAAGADPREVDVNGLSALHWLAQRDDSVQVLRPFAELLLCAGCALEAREQLYGASALAWAGWHGSTGAAEALLCCGAELESQDQYGGTPLRWAVQNNHAATARVLREVQPGPTRAVATLAEQSLFRRSLQEAHAPRLESHARVQAALAVRCLCLACEEATQRPLPGSVAAQLALLLLAQRFTLWPPVTRARV